MLSNIVSMLTKSLSSTQTISSLGAAQVKSNNPFSGYEKENPFLSTTYGSGSTYGKNQPVSGGYFAGYYNGKPNIVGRRLFIEI